MPLSTEQRGRLESLRRKYGINFSRRHVPQAEWPGNYRDEFKAIKILGETKYESYAAHVKKNKNSIPWESGLLRLVANLTEKAERNQRRNEATWRFSCEPLIFSRLNSDIACPNCRKRLWRSAIEVSVKHPGDSAESLKTRQKNRAPCRCPTETRPQDSSEMIGLNPLFTHREQEPVIHEPELAEELSKGEQPDMVYGLRQTRNFEAALYAKPGQGQSKAHTSFVRDLLKRPPLSEEGDPLLFPFLVLEAKSGKSPDDWHSIKLQTSFPIRTFLEYQRSLQDATGERSKGKAGPLVWFFMNKGEDWRLCACFTEGETQVRIMELWDGCVQSRDGALQLFLIVDYIFDWARDSYRPDILNELRILAMPENTEIQSVFTDSDIYSSGLFKGKASEPDEQGSSRHALMAFGALDSSEGIPRYASEGGSMTKVLKPPRQESTLSLERLRLRRVRYEKSDDERSEHFRSVLNVKPIRIQFQDITSLQSILRDFLQRCEKARPHEDSYAAIEDLLNQISSWRPGVNLVSITNREFNIDLSYCKNSNEAILQRTIMTSIIDRWQLHDLFVYNCEGQWKLPDKYRLPTRSMGDMVSFPKPDLAVSFTLEAFTGPDMSAPFPKDIGQCMRPDGGVGRCFPFLFMEVKRGTHDLKHASMANLHSASQALFNIYVWMLQAGHQDIFFDSVRVFSIVLNAQEISMRVHRAVLVPSTTSLTYHFDDIVTINGYSRDQACLLFKNVLIEYGEKELYGILKATFEEVSRQEDESKQMEERQLLQGKRKADPANSVYSKKVRSVEGAAESLIDATSSFGASGLEIS